MSLDDLYQEVILDHYRSPRNRGTLARPSVSTRGDNPLCGDELSLQIAFGEGPARIEEITFEGHGCSISLASASIMTTLVKGRTAAEARDLGERFRAMLRSGEEDEALGDGAALVGVSKFPVRVKCASLAWTTLEQALSEAGL